MMLYLSSAPLSKCKEINILTNLLLLTYIFKAFCGIIGAQLEDTPTSKIVIAEKLLTTP